MDAFLAICQGLGVAIAVGLVLGAVVPPSMPTWGLLAGAVVLGIVACGLSLSADDEAIWPAVFVGAVGAGLAAQLARDVAAGAARRELAGEAPETEPRQPSAMLATLIVLAAISVALVSIVVPPLALPPLAGLIWLALARGRRERRKHEGLRVLR